MSQKDKIINILKNSNKSMKQSEIAIFIYHDNTHSPAIYSSLQQLVKDNIIIKTKDRTALYSLNRNRIVIPTPSNDQVIYWINKWNDPDNYKYKIQEEAIDDLFKLYKTNVDLKNIIIKCSILNDFYSTNIFDVYSVALHIFELDIDKKLNNNDLTLVNDIANVKIINKCFYSFATKYCSHHKPDTYPLYDYYVDKMLCYFKKKDKFYNFNKNDLKDYEKFKHIIDEFINYYKLNEFNYKKIDQYLWMAGKSYFKRNYNKKNQ